MMKILPILVVALIATIDATTTIPADLRDLTRDARAIARGRVTSVDARWTEDRRAIETIVTLQAEQYLKGTLGESLQFRVPGGRLGRFRSIMVGAPEFAAGDEVVLFLKGRPPAVPFPFGLSQGVYRVVRGGDGRSLVTPPIVSEAAGRVVRGDVSRRPLELSAFTRNVRAIAERQP